MKNAEIGASGKTTVKKRKKHKKATKPAVFLRFLRLFAANYRVAPIALKNLHSSFCIFLIPVMFRLVRALTINAEIIRLLAGERFKPDTQLTQMQTGYFFIQDLG